MLWHLALLICSCFPHHLPSRHFRMTHVQGPPSSLLMRNRSPTSQIHKLNRRTLSHGVLTASSFQNCLRPTQLPPLGPKCEVPILHLHQQLTSTQNARGQILATKKWEKEWVTNAEWLVTPGRTFFGTSTTTCSLNGRLACSIQNTPYVLSKCCKQCLSNFQASNFLGNCSGFSPSGAAPMAHWSCISASWIQENIANMVRITRKKRKYAMPNSTAKNPT